MTLTSREAFVAAFDGQVDLKAAAHKAAVEASIANAKVDVVQTVGGRFPQVTFRMSDTERSLSGFRVGTVVLSRQGVDNVVACFKAEGEGRALWANETIPADDDQVTWADVEADPARAAHRILEWWV